MLWVYLCQEQLRLSRKGDECKPLPTSANAQPPMADASARNTKSVTQGLTLVHVKTELEQVQDTFMS